MIYSTHSSFQNKTMATRNVYEEKVAISEEKKRLEGFPYPFTVSISVIGDNIEGKKILDLGSGPNKSLGNWANSLKASYFPCDISKEFLLNQMSNGNTNCCLCSAHNLPFENNTFDIAHVRFLLIHVNDPHKRAQLINQVVSVCKNFMFLEFDWSTFKYGPIVGEFVKLTLEIMKEIADFDIGRRLEQEISRVAPIRSVTKHKRPIGNYYREILPLANSLKATASKINPNLIDRADEMIVNITKESEKEEPELFTPPEIVVVTN